MQFPSTQLTTLLTVIDLGTLDAAAKQLHLTPSAVSQRIKALESSVGQVLVRRGTPCSPTDAGTTIIRLARQTRLLQAEAAVELSSGAAVELPVAVNADSLSVWWRGVFAEVGGWTGVSLRITLDDQAFSAGLLRSGDVLAAVTDDPTPVQGCSVEHLGVMHYRPAATPTLVEAHTRGGELHWAELPAVVFNDKDRLQHDVLVARGAAGPSIQHRVPSSADFAEAVRAGLGWGMLPVAQLDPLVVAGELTVLDDTVTAVQLYWQRWRLDSPLLDRLTDAVRRAARARLG